MDRAGSERWEKIIIGINVVRESVDEEDQCGRRGCGLSKMERSVGETWAMIDCLFDRPSMSSCTLYSHLEGYASSLALHKPPLLQRKVERRQEYSGVWWTCV